MSNIVVLIVAAGSSSRMGSPKQLLKWKDTTLINHAIHNVKTIKPSKLIVVLGANYELISPKLDIDDLEVLNHEHWEDGLGSSIAYGVQHIKKSTPDVDGILIMLGDQPLIGSEFLQLLINNFQTDKKQIIASGYSNGKPGVPVLFDTFYLEELSTLTNDNGAKPLLHKYVEHIITINARNKIADIDTKAEYERLYKDNHY